MGGVKERVQLRKRLLTHGNFRLSLAGDGLLQPGDYSRQMQRLVTTTAA